MLLFGAEAVIANQSYKTELTSIRKAKTMENPEQHSTTPIPRSQIARREKLDRRENTDGYEGVDRRSNCDRRSGAERRLED